VTSRKVTIGGRLPFSAERARQLVTAANGFSSNILLLDSHGTFNGKSMLGLLSLGKLSGRELTLLAEGADEERAAVVLATLLEEASPS
jgi:phosphotransferase system HPr (HPr) family protein